MVGSLIGAGVGIVGSLIGGKKKKKGAEQAAAANTDAAKQSLMGFNYLTDSPVGRQYVPAGGAANAQQAALLGLGQPAAYGGGTAASAGPNLDDEKQKFLMGASGWLDPKHSGKFSALVNSGQVNLQDPTSVMQALQSIDTRPDNAQRIVNSLGNFNFAPPPAATAVTAAPTTTGTTDSQNAAFDNYLNSTGHQFRLKTGQDALTGSAAARGILNSGATAKALTKFGQDLGTEDFNNYFNQLGGVAGQGLTAGQSIGAAGTAGGANSGQFTSAAGNARAAGANASGNAFEQAAGIAGGALANNWGGISNFFGSIF